MFEKLRFGDLLRYGFSGGTFLLALALARGGFNSVISGGVGLAESTALTLVALVIGSFIYSLHRALVHRFITRCLTNCVDRNHPALALPKSDSFLVKTFNRDYARWIRRSRHPTFQGNMDFWSSQILFLYGCAWAIGTGAFLGRLLSTGWRDIFVAPQNRCTFYILLGIALVSFCSACWQDYIAHYYDRKLMGKDLDRDLCEPRSTE